MKNLHRYLAITCGMLLGAAGLLLAVVYHPTETGFTVTLNIAHVVGKRTLQLDSMMYVNAAGQKYSVTMFKYYIGNFVLKRADGQEIRIDNYALVNEEESRSKRIALPNIPAGTYVNLSFTLGVDSARNCSGVQSGALDPVHGMFWAWNTGYIFMKLEGKSPKSTASGNVFEYHIGGFKAPNNCIRRVSIPLTPKLKVGTSVLPVISLNADVAEVLRRPMNIDFAKIPTVAGPLHATEIANNYADMFSLKRIQ